MSCRWRQSALRQTILRHGVICVPLADIGYLPFIFSNQKLTLERRRSPKWNVVRLTLIFQAHHRPLYRDLTWDYVNNR